MENMPSRYSLVVVAAKRARQLAEKDHLSDKHVSEAIEQIADGKVRIRRED